MKPWVARSLVHISWFFVAFESTLSFSNEQTHQPLSLIQLVSMGGSHEPDRLNMPLKEWT